MSSIHNDLHSWAGKARSRGLPTIEITTEFADSASDIIVSQANEIAALREAINLALVGGNHIASELIGRVGAGFSDEFPPDADPETVLRRLHATVEYEMWCAWSALMRARQMADEVAS